MNMLFLKLISPLFSAIKNLVNIYRSTTDIEVHGVEVSAPTKDTLYILDKGNNGGLLCFAVATTSKKPIIVSKIAIEFSAPLQLLDPGRRGFFSLEATLNPELPFQTFSSASFTITKEYRSMFALDSIFPDTTTERSVIFCIYAKKEYPSFFGFLTQGKTQVTRLKRNIRLTTEAVGGIVCPPGSGINIDQPFLIDQQLLCGGEKEGSFIINLFSKDGTAISNHVKIP